ncbi:MAG: 2Fe-2S iron-sulfur cluster binding domain-containing protein [Ectothiorhodospiraceae bacterium]|nr:2Fe-2S iron-sulfur cluster binding domain-containing protein [Ectothiorhodospiraceae bacterium]MCH8504844.1 2Fe-2S iron-sulfur cluster binding domain-containing protein [Ectothiorhodospiraceae bacterium]
MPHTITIAGTTHQFEAGEDEPILDAAMRQGLELPFDCQVGGCGACRVKVLEGEIDYDLPPMALTADEEEAGMALSCQAIARSPVVIEVEGLGGGSASRPAMAGPRRVTGRVAALEQLCHDVMWVVLELPDGETAEFRAGQYLDVILPDGSRRSFSMASAPGRGFLDLHVRNVPGGLFTGQVFGQTAVGDAWELELPLGGFYLREDSDRPLLMVAGGTGLAPIKSLLESAMEQRCSRAVHLYWGVRSSRDLYLDEQVARWGERLSAYSYVPVLSEPGGEDWKGRTGFVHQAVVEDLPDLSAFDAYLCGPPPMIDAAKRAFAAVGMPVDRMFADSFNFSHELNPEPLRRIS